MLKEESYPPNLRSGMARVRIIINCYWCQNIIQHFWPFKIWCQPKQRGFFLSRSFRGTQKEKRGFEQNQKWSSIQVTVTHPKFMTLGNLSLKHTHTHTHKRTHTHAHTHTHTHTNAHTQTHISIDKHIPLSIDWMRPL